MATKFKNLWVEKYRPKKIDDYIFENADHEVAFKTFIEEKSIPHLLLTGVAGSGKSTIAQILIDELGVEEADLLSLNASDENSVDVMREKINSFVMSYAFGELGCKIVLLEEADYITLNGQAVLRRLMEEYVDEARFILTGNYENKIKPAIKSRCQHFRFRSSDKDDIAEYAATILVEEGIKFELDQLDLYVSASYPDIRKIVNSIQQSIDNGKLIDLRTGTSGTEDYKIALISHISNDAWEPARKIVCENVTNEEFEEIYRFLYNNLDKSKKFSKQTLWEEGQLRIAEYLYMHSIVADPEINLSALFIELKRI